jgi:hypothetical protein
MNMSKQSVTEDAICSKHLLYIGSHNTELTSHLYGFLFRYDGSEESCVICEQAAQLEAVKGSLEAIRTSPDVWTASQYYDAICDVLKTINKRL